jgi:hypothetical protein
MPIAKALDQRPAVRDLGGRRRVVDSSRAPDVGQPGLDACVFCQKPQHSLPIPLLAAQPELVRLVS